MVRDFADVPQKFIKDGSQVRRNCFGLLGFFTKLGYCWLIPSHELITFIPPPCHSHFSFGPVRFHWTATHP